MFSAFVDEVGISSVNILEPLQFSGLLFGALLPYWFTAMTMKSVGKAALAMVSEVRRQFREYPGIMTGVDRPDYSQCVKISTDASLKEMIPPATLVLFTPVVVGVLFGVDALAGMLAGALVSGVQIAISSSNTGGAWDNAKVRRLGRFCLNLNRNTSKQDISALEKAKVQYNIKLLSLEIQLEILSRTLQVLL